MNQSLFGHLAQSFSTHPENLATEALAFILDRSPAAAEALGRLFSTTGATIPTDLRYRTQVADQETGITDLVGFSKENEQLLICEAKFWAGLTDNQPVGYMNRGPRLLIFIAPSIRLPTLWPELLTRCKNAGINPQSLKQITQDLYVAKTSDKQLLATTSWRFVLNCLIEALTSHGDQNSASDVRQLQGLCEQMDADAFLPIRSDELSPLMPRRLLQFNQLVDTLTDKFVELGLASTSGTRATPQYGGYYRYMKACDFGWTLQVNYYYWSKLRETPLWLRVDSLPEITERLASLTHEIPPRLIREQGNLLIPLVIPLRAERDAVVESLFAQLKGVYDLLHSRQTTIDIPNPIKSPIGKI